MYLRFSLENYLGIIFPSSICASGQLLYLGVPLLALGSIILSVRWMGRNEGQAEHLKDAFVPSGRLCFSSVLKEKSGGRAEHCGAAWGCCLRRFLKFRFCAFLSATILNCCCYFGFNNFRSFVCFDLRVL